MKRCPRCGGLPSVKWRGIGNDPHGYGPKERLYRMVCLNAECRVNPTGPEAKSEEEAERAWDDRVSFMPFIGKIESTPEERKPKEGYRIEKNK